MAMNVFVRLMRYYVVPKVNYLSFQVDMFGSHEVEFPLRRRLCYSHLNKEISLFSGESMVKYHETS